ncbi:hypothetical protein [Nocardioides anomalus]|uniref:hypothetical protein n=1 Tax=Nocardioides anomalus TaxID=2712223 RepID=UPI001E588A74|nr:hypothetical protein [Nocardioides anomalus]
MSQLMIPVSSSVGGGGEGHRVPRPPAFDSGQQPGRQQGEQREEQRVDDDEAADLLEHLRGADQVADRHVGAWTDVG